MLTGFGLQHISSLLIKHASSVLFVQITSDGHSGSGQTPGIAWEKFQKERLPSHEDLAWKEIFGQDRWGGGRYW
jgi:hypothetical protein